MKYFTMDLWCGTQPDHGDQEWSRRCDVYTRELEAIKSKLPPDLLQSRGELHDAELRRAEYHRDRGELALEIEPFERPVHDPAVASRVLWVYAGVTRVEWANHRQGLPGPPGFGHMGYEEIELAGDGFAERILFSTGLELAIWATGFRRELVSQ